MPTITNHQGNVNQNHNEISLHNHWGGYDIYIRREITSVGKDVEKLEPLCIAGM